MAYGSHFYTELRLFFTFFPEHGRVLLLMEIDLPLLAEAIFSVHPASSVWQEESSNARNCDGCNKIRGFETGNLPVNTRIVSMRNLVTEETHTLCQPQKRVGGCLDAFKAEHTEQIDANNDTTTPFGHRVYLSEPVARVQEFFEGNPT